MENFSFLNSENFSVGDKPKGEKRGKSSNVGTMPRTVLTDISNLGQPKISNKIDKLHFNLGSSTKSIEQLHMENAALLKLLADRNKLIEFSGNELQKLRLNFQKVQQQNVQLAQANSHLLVELNSDKDKRKALLHELGCKNGLIEALKFASQAKTKIVTCQENQNKNPLNLLKHEAPQPESSEVKNDDGKPDTINKRQQSENQTLPQSSNQVKTKEKTENKRRRQSARFIKSEDPKPSEDLFKIDDVIFPVSHLKLLESDPSFCSLDVKEEDSADCALDSGVQQSRRSSTGRPQRRAAGKIQTYKETPINVKLRRGP